MAVLGIIPARGGSKGIHRKNLSILENKPLIVHTIEMAIKSNIDKVIVTTEDEKIAETALKFRVIAPFMRPKNLATDSSNSIDVAIHALKEMEKITKIEYQSIMYLQPTTPFRNFEDINMCLELLKRDKNADSVISVVNVSGYHPARMKYIEEGYLIDPEFCETKENQNRQELRPMFIRNGAIYLSSRDTLLGRSFKGKKSLAYEMPLNRSVNIDTYDDLEFARWLIKNKSKNI